MKLSRDLKCQILARGTWPPISRGGRRPSVPRFDWGMLAAGSRKPVRPISSERTAQSGVRLFKVVHQPRKQIVMSATPLRNRSRPIAEIKKMAKALDIWGLGPRYTGPMEAIGWVASVREMSKLGN